ncbi:sulfatase-like hydrolase/transferase [Mucilaginibacter sp. HMF7410]|uniref:Sulfatase-like hydrolase/transferase n=2 Tax=Mucilaginibacter arboris TaxID=2682090 RepID=A0A7K1ST51_9SPHI|nr:sulfatase-like hydrolase/transferase [Mucilaginibacter arboris]
MRITKTLFNNSLRSAFFGVLFFVHLAEADAQQKAQTAKRPNIVIIISDDHAYQAISAYGSKLMQTPNIDRIAKGGVTFNKAYVTNSICGPSRAVILTGKYSNKNGFKDNENSRFNGDQDSFIKQLKASGYLTAWIGKWHLESQPQGFDYWEILPGQGSYYNPDFLTMDGGKKKVEGYVSNIVEDETESWLDKRDKSKPFCLVIGHKATHRTWLPDTCDMGRFDKTTFPLPHDFYDNYANRIAAQQQEMSIAKDMQMGYDLKMLQPGEEEGTINRMNAAQRQKFDAYYKPIQADLKARHLSGNALAEWKYQRYMRDYLSTATSLDRNIGRTLDYLDKNHLTENTIVIYMSDQGFYLGEHGWFDKRWMYEESFRTPMVMRYPGVIKPETKSEDFVMNVDIAPTMLDAAKVAIPKDMQGESMLPLFNNKKAKGRDEMYYHYYENGEHAVSPQFGVRTKRYKLIRFYKRVNNWELYDLQNDKGEMNNLYGKKGYEKITAELKNELNKQIDKYQDDDAKLVLTQK